jgi:hypothetical protein
MGALVCGPLPAFAAGGGVSMRVTGCQSAPVSLPAFRGRDTATELHVTGHWAIGGLFDPHDPAGRNVAFGYLPSIIAKVGVDFPGSTDSWSKGTALLLLCTDAPGWIRVSIPTMSRWVTVRPIAKATGRYLTAQSTPTGPVDPSTVRRTIPQARTTAVVMGARFDHATSANHADLCVTTPGSVPCEVAHSAAQPMPVYYTDDNADIVTTGIYDRAEFPNCTQAELDVAAAGSAGPARLEIGYVTFA